jgi:predicted porin
MHKTNLRAVAIAAAMLSGGAYAQTNVSIYGVMDSGVEYTNHAGTAGSAVRLMSGGTNTSRIGFKGAEDLGGGLKAIFQLEGGILLDTGASDGNLFGRQANVGFQGGFGRVVAGRSYSTTYDFMLPFDPQGYSPLYSWATSGNATGGRKDGMLTGVSNMIKYQGEFGGVKIGATYGFGETAGDTSDSSKYALAGGYTGGPFSAALVYDRVNGTAAPATPGKFDKTTTIHLGLGYAINPSVKVLFGYRDYKKALASGASDLRSDMYWTGVSYKASPAVTLTSAVYYQNIKNVAAGTDADPLLFALRAKYTMSKRTFLYASLGYARAKNNQLVSVSRDDAGFADNQTGVTVGVQHRF